jgi:hypothetical protein
LKDKRKKEQEGEKSILSQKRERISDVNSTVYQTRKQTRNPMWVSQKHTLKLLGKRPEEKDVLTYH